jgi:CubicO group peptidase (beta-lactamase class C family)
MKTVDKPTLAILLIGTLTCLLLAGKGSIAQVKTRKSGQSSSMKTASRRDELTARLEKSIPQLMSDGDVPGLSIALIRNSKVVWHRGFGVKNAATKEPVDDGTVFEAASLSKPVFAYAVLKLVDRGVLDLDTPLVKYLPGAYVEGDERLKLITARMVLTHTTGFPNWRPRGEPLKIHFTPGEKFSYSGEGFVYLQRVVEHLSGQRLEQLMRREVFGPLGMTSSSYLWLDSYDKLKATGHNSSGLPTARRQPTEENAAASLQTTALDYSRFVIAILEGKGIKREMLRRMLTTQVRVDEACSDCIGRKLERLSKSVSWGLGWGLQQTEDGTAFWHWGSNNGDVQCYTEASERQKTGIVIFTNSGNGLSIIPEIVQQAMGGHHPAFSWIGSEPYNSPARKLLRDIIARGVEVALRDYRERRKNAAGGERLNEGQINQIGYQLLATKRVKEAIEVFKLNVEDYPASFNVYDSLGEAYMANGDKELAIKNYRKSVELNPDNRNGVEMLKKLEQK